MGQSEDFLRRSYSQSLTFYNERRQASRDWIDNSAVGRAFLVVDDYNSARAQGQLNAVKDTVVGTLQLAYNLAPHATPGGALVYEALERQGALPSWAPKPGQARDQLTGALVSTLEFGARVQRYDLTLVLDGARLIQGKANQYQAAYETGGLNGAARAIGYDQGYVEANIAMAVAPLPKGLNFLAKAGTTGTRSAMVSGEAGRLIGAADDVARVGAGAAKSGDALLLERGVTDAGLRQSILDTGFNPTILGDASLTTMIRFDKLFQGSFDAGKAFRGRLGNLATRARTIETAIEIDRLGLTPSFETMVRLDSGSARFVDVAGLNAVRKPVSYFQLYRETSIGTMPSREVNAANDIFNATGIRPTMIRTGP